MKKTGHLKVNKSKERNSRRSLTVVLSVFVFAIIFFAIALAALILWILSKVGVIVDIEGNLQLGQVVLMMSIISIVIGTVIAFLSSRIPLKPVNKLINKMNRLALQYSCLENSMDRGGWWATVHGVTNSWTQLSNAHT